MSFFKKAMNALKIKLKQRVFYNGKFKIKYLFNKAQSKTLIIVFSGFPGEKQTAKYNYIRTIEEIKANKLFILDDIGPRKRGAYYLGENKDFYFEKMVVSLINNIKKDICPEQVICIGSSKGGYASMYFGLKINANVIISGAQQYFIGNYLMSKPEHQEILRYIMGDKSEESISYLNLLLENLIYNSSSRPLIYLHYSKNEHMYPEHISFLLLKLKELNYTVIEDIKSYVNHNEVVKYFPQYVLSVIKENLK